MRKKTLKYFVFLKKPIFANTLIDSWKGQEFIKHKLEKQVQGNGTVGENDADRKAEKTFNQSN